jgi:CubicO group peptidase (beta-lactamase class C family)
MEEDMKIHLSMLGPDFEKIVKDAIAKYQPIADTGVAVAVIKDGALAYAGGFGFRDRAICAPVDAETCFAIGSATKAFTSMAASMYADDNTIALDTPIKQLLPDFDMNDPQADSQTTLLDILCHRTGLAPHNWLWFLGPFTRSELFYRIRYLEPLLPFRTGYAYSNLMYMVAGYLLETLLGVNYEDIIKTRILDKLDMKATNLSFESLTTSANHAKGYEGAADLALKDFTNIGPAAEINSHALDMAKWIQFFLRKGLTSSGNPIISQPSLERMYYPFTDPGDGTKYGLGWNIGSIQPVANPSQNKRLIFHTGDPVGGAAYVSFMPDDELGVVVLTNQHCTFKLINSWPDKVATDIYDHLVNGQLTGQLTLPKRPAHTGLGMTAPPPAVTEPAAAAAPANPDSYTGMFRNDGYGEFVVSRSGANLNISYYGSSWPLQPLSDTTFFFQVAAFGAIFKVPLVFAKDSGTGAFNSFGATLVLQPRPISISFAKC